MCGRKFKIASVFKILVFALLPTSFYFTAKYFYLRENSYQIQDVIHCKSSDILPDISKEILPEVDILVGIFHGSINYYEQLLIPSLRYFWPGHVSITIILNDKSPNNRNQGDVLARKYPFPRVCFQSPKDPLMDDLLEYKRMETNTFYPERFASRKYVGYVYTDSVFLTKVTRQLFFEDNKPVIIGLIDLEDDIWRQSSEMSALIFKTRDTIQCASSFPFIVKVEHVIALRKYLESIQGKSFEELYKVIAKSSITNFSIICQYIWMFHRNDYIFYFNEMKLKRSLNSIGENYLEGSRMYAYYDIISTHEQRVPKPKPSIPYRYLHNWKGHDTLQKMFKTGLCFSGGFDVCVDFCKEVDKNSLQESIFRIARSDWTWDERCINEQRKHYGVVNASYKDQNALETINTGCREVENMHFKIPDVDLEKMSI